MPNHPNRLYLQSFKNISPSSASQNTKTTQITSSYQRVCSKIKAQELAMINAIFNEDDLAQFENLAKKTANYKKILVLGVGGSSLGGKTLTSLKFQDKLQFLESIDPATIHNELSKIDYHNTFFLVISKSGETIETICQSLIIMEKLQKLNIKNYQEQFLFITESQENSVAKIAKKIGAEIFPHPQNIGGRYSCFCVVGMLPTIICGLDAKKVRMGARKILTDFLENENNDILQSCGAQIELYQQGFTSNVVMPYIDALKNFTDWYRQLFAESLGKNGFGATPINSMGTVDQHSQLQLYLDGPKNKFFTFFTLSNPQHDFVLTDLPECATLFGGKNLSEIVAIEQETTIATLNQKKLPIRIFTLQNLDEETLGALMMHMFLETILLAEIENINPFDQPAVELRKDLAKKMLKYEI